MGWIAAAIIGLIAGAIAKAIMPGRDPGGWIVTMLIGIAGAVLMTWIGQALGFYAPNEKAGFIAAIIGAIVLLGGYRLIKR
ncbi:GlsB/YeaQ/YmgE family stress response membrane protein [Polymorphobacter arshaanensis]|jgi:uncharacterized membrane protein YeaQ/YmgE (transglycosylase-associated protein family)|uniref:GlsB/YeaQ/YmgE family stress response membrane protein n=1 Tax=Glacieibacterium arshaanense TaxID=2511025 RepID=A0A4Y9EMZ0_9SPHN|nr:GlsB/YeaQ/YmgE family stress response membrane protein [Polymorphobacter arshaanensis]TFU03070.1 GlsB/YeaQ/YmgE family stress response membrane protein [Polymorphobacter arshaanensis]